MSKKRNGINKSKVGFSIDRKVNDEFEDYCLQTLANKSAIVNSLIKKFLKNKAVDVEADNMDI